ncbi:MAG TPA: Ig-like domain-containing protein [Gemmatimonadaceae bacterium]|nr:Ig-like domain-containing protein [Gemmatimonadaceae bacterium]
MNPTPTSMIATTLALLAVFSCTDSPTDTGLSADDLSVDANRVVAAIQVHLASDTIAVGQTTQATVTMQDRRGRPIDRAVQWSSSNPAIAAVSGSGLVTGKAAGNATIVATHRTVTGSATVTVTAADSVAPPPPPPPGQLLFKEDFENTNISARGWYDNTRVQLSTTEHISGSTASAQYHWLKGATTPVSGDTQRHKFTPSSSVYLSYYVKYSTNYVGSGQDYHPHEFYILSTMDGDYDGPSDNFLDIYVEQNYQNGGKPIIDVQDNKSINTSRGSLPNNLIGVTENRSVSGCNGMVEKNMYSECYDAGDYWYNYKQLSAPVQFQPSPGDGYKSNWNFVEAYVQLNTVVNGVGQPNGVIQYWFNGKLVIDRHDVLFRTAAHPTLQLNQFLIGPYIGDGSPVDQYMWVDNLRVATGRIP